ncbi:hypothetical protein T12_11532 [Trichinella patagoniensis]|uniref:Uncharacterized protein n=1 Tax=Trichinella patagoniensis TaxID=990121 RepID=A0A0V0YZX0_9BILA|nr:hypothetical protein T12_11532 [Trichinella patagoniensis]
MACMLPCMLPPPHQLYPLEHRAAAHLTLLSGPTVKIRRLKSTIPAQSPGRDPHTRRPKVKKTQKNGTLRNSQKQIRHLKIRESRKARKPKKKKTTRNDQTKGLRTKNKQQLEA